MSKWPYFVVALLPPVAIAVGVFVGIVRLSGEAGEAAGEAVASAIGSGFRIGMRQDPELVISPGEPGYLGELDTVGAQLHYYAEGMEKTTVAGDVRIGDEVVRLPLALYHGHPRRDATWPEMTATDVTLAILVVRVVGGREGIAVSVTAANERHERRTANGEARFLLRPGSYAIETDGARLGHVALSSREKVWCTAHPDRVEIDSRR